MHPPTPSPPAALRGCPGHPEAVALLRADPEVPPTPLPELKATLAWHSLGHPSSYELGFFSQVAGKGVLGYWVPCSVQASDSLCGLQRASVGREADGWGVGRV